MITSYIYHAQYNLTETHEWTELNYLYPGLIGKLMPTTKTSKSKYVILDPPGRFYYAISNETIFCRIGMCLPEKCCTCTVWIEIRTMIPIVEPYKAELKDSVIILPRALVECSKVMKKAFTSGMEEEKAEKKKTEKKKTSKPPKESGDKGDKVSLEL